jgi:hypothetical protein
MANLEIVPVDRIAMSNGMSVQAMLTAGAPMQEILATAHATAALAAEANPALGPVPSTQALAEDGLEGKSAALHLMSLTEIPERRSAAIAAYYQAQEIGF